MKELHLIIIWNRHNHLVDHLAQFISGSLSIVKEVSLERSSRHYLRNFERFYNKPMPLIRGKLDHCYDGEATMFLIEDNAPVYEQRSTSSGPMLVNTNLFDLKSFLRKHVGGGHSIHATNSVEEFNKDITLLAGQAGLDLITTPSPETIKAFPSVLYDPVGTDSWESLSLFFSILPYHTNYVVMRNFQNLPHAPTYGPHSDVDLLVESFSCANLLLNGQKVLPHSWRVHYKKEFNGGDAFFDIRHVEDNYYDKERSDRLLQAHDMYNDVIRVPNDIDHFYTLLYHALIHKKQISDDYIQQLHLLGKKMGLSLPSHRVDDLEKIYYSFLHKKIYEEDYSITIPHDYSVFFNEKGLKNVPGYKNYVVGKKIMRKIYSLPYSKYFFYMIDRSFYKYSLFYEKAKISVINILGFFKKPLYKRSN